jgi:hypothetical protein
MLHLVGFKDYTAETQDAEKIKWGDSELFFLPLRLGVFAGDIPISFLRSLRPLRSIIRFRIVFAYGSAALSSLRLIFPIRMLFRCAKRTLQVFFAPFAFFAAKQFFVFFPRAR